MKNILIIVLFSILFFSLIIEAQVVFDYGVKISLTSSNIKLTDKKSNGLFNSDDFYNGVSINPSVGLFFNYRITENLILESELSYIQKGSRKTMEVFYTTIDNPDGDGRKTDYTYEIGVHYLELGLNIKPTIQIGGISSYAIIGSSLNYTLQATNVMKDKITEFIISYKLGLGANIQTIINIPMFIEIKYIGDVSEFYSYDYGKFWNRVFVFSAGINF